MNVYILSTLSSSKNIINSLQNTIKIQGIIGLTKRDSTDEISDYVFMEDYCKEKDLEFISVQSYNLKNLLDIKKIQSLNIDLLLVMGWQRLIPNRLIEQCKICVIGAHGSSYGIIGGRGRSPQNWSLILGEKEFQISIYEIDLGVDSGEVIETCSFPITEFDDIQTMYYKSGLLTAKMIIDNINNKKILNIQTNPQKGTPKYLPQRKPEDGYIDWNRSTNNIYNFIRALTKPYPGAFTKINSYNVKIWKAKPFKILKNIFDGKPGEILKIFSNGNFLVKTSDGVLLVEEYSYESEKKFDLKENSCFISANFKTQIKQIIDRHYEKYPENKINDNILNLIK